MLAWRWIPCREEERRIVSTPKRDRDHDTARPTALLQGEPPNLRNCGRHRVREIRCCGSSEQVSLGRTIFDRTAGQHGTVGGGPAGVPAAGIHPGGPGLPGIREQPLEFPVDFGRAARQHRQHLRAATLGFLFLRMATGIHQPLTDPVGVGQQEGPPEGRPAVQPMTTESSAPWKCTFQPSAGSWSSWGLAP